MRIRAATIDDAPTLGHVMVESWLSGHHGQIPEVTWRKRRDEWTPDVSARGWARVLADQAASAGHSDVLLVAEDSAGTLDGLVYATSVEDTAGGAAIEALYVSSGRRGQGVGTALLRAAGRELARIGCTAISVEVLTANIRARRFYELLGAVEVGHSTFDEEGHSLPVTVYEWPDATTLTGT